LGLDTTFHPGRHGDGVGVIGGTRTDTGVATRGVILAADVGDGEREGVADGGTTVVVREGSGKGVAVADAGRIGVRAAAALLDGMRACT
jgi:hypothetical protein